MTNDSSPISRVRGHIIRAEKYSLIPTFHPSYLLRNPSAKKMAWEDFLTIRGIMEKEFSS
jgi:DNA polymerase